MSGQILRVGHQKEVVDVRQKMDADEPRLPRAGAELLGHLLGDRAETERRGHVAERQPAAAHESPGDRVPNEHAIPAGRMDRDVEEAVSQVVFGKVRGRFGQRPDIVDTREPAKGAESASRFVPTLKS